jgi:hypothetical protein
MHEVLISYSKTDKKWADAACSVLEARGIRCWIAPRDILPGAEWGAAIIVGIDACRVMVLIFSSSANASPQVRREVERAISKGLTVIPCRIEDVRPEGAMEYALGNTHWLDVFTPPVERQMQRLAESVQALLPRERGDSRVAGGPSLASDSTGRNESLRESNIPRWNWRGKNGLVAAAGFTLFVLLAVSVTVVFWPRKEAVSTLKNADTVGAGQTASPGKSPPAATSATPAQPLPAKPQAAKKPANDYDAIATGRWLPLMASLDDFKRVLAQKSYEGPEPKFDQGVLELPGPPRGGLPGEINFVGFPGIRAKNIIIRARVRKLSPRPRGPHYRGSNVGLAVRCDENNACAALLTGRNKFVIARGKWQDLSPPHVLEGQYDVDFFEFAFAAIGDKLTAYVNGRQILELPVDPSLPQTPGEVRVSVYSGGGLFQDIEVQVLDKPIVTPRTPPRPVERSNSSPVPVEPKPTAADGFVPLFNGKDLSGWKTYPNQPGNWRVEDGVLIGSASRVSHLYTQRDDYTDFHLRVEARLNDGGNSGVCFRAQPGIKLRLPAGYEADISNPRNRGATRTGSLFVPGAGALVGIHESLVPPGQWFTMEVTAQGNHIVVKVNGKTTVDYPDEERRFASGHIALQQLTPATVVEFRKIEIKELPAAAPSGPTAAASS